MCTHYFLAAGVRVFLLVALLPAILAGCDESAAPTPGPPSDGAASVDSTNRDAAAEPSSNDAAPETGEDDVAIDTGRGDTGRADVTTDVFRNDVSGDDAGGNDVLIEHHAHDGAADAATLDVSIDTSGDVPTPDDAPNDANDDTADAACPGFGTPCTPAQEGTFCGRCGDPCTWCWVVRCSLGKWEGVEVPPLPPDLCKDGGDASSD